MKDNRREIEWIDIDEQEPMIGQMVLACDNNRIMHIIVANSCKWKSMINNKGFGATNICFWSELPELPNEILSI